MSRIFITGDLHGGMDIGKLSTFNFPIQNTLNKEDIVIITGDIGIVWDNTWTDCYWQRSLDKRNFTTLCCLGNHENYNLIKAYPMVNKFGGKVRKITPSVYYAEGGEIYTINSKTFLFINGADSQDKKYRTENKDWWAGEVISEEQIKVAKDNLKQYNNKVDYIISHTGGIEITKIFNFIPTISDIRLSQLLDDTEYTHHWCGHYHEDIETPNGKATVLYNSIQEIKIST